MISRILFGWFLVGSIVLAAGCADDPDGDLPPLPPPVRTSAVGPNTVGNVDYRYGANGAVAVAPSRAPLPVNPRPALAPNPAVPAGWIPKVPVNHWTWIIIHHSDSDYGSAAIIDQWHRARGFDELGYHFVIGNGTNSGDGQIEIGPRWTKQKWGAHDNALDNRYNISGIGICLVGNFQKTHPTAAQLSATIKLVAYLMKTYHIAPDHVLGHGDTKTTDCPGKYVHVAEIRAAAVRLLADEGDADAQKYAKLAEYTIAPDGSGK